MIREFRARLPFCVPCGRGRVPNGRNRAVGLVVALAALVLETAGEAPLAAAGDVAAERLGALDFALERLVVVSALHEALLAEELKDAIAIRVVVEGGGEDESFEGLSEIEIERAAVAASAARFGEEGGGGGVHRGD